MNARVTSARVEARRRKNSARHVVACLAVVLGVAACTPDSHRGEVTKENRAERQETPSKGESLAIRRQMEERQLALETSILEGRLAEVREPAQTIRDLASRAVEHAGRDSHEAERERAVEGIRDASERVIAMGESGNQPGAEAELVKLNAAIVELWAVLPREGGEIQ